MRALIQEHFPNIRENNQRIYPNEYNYFSIYTKNKDNVLHLLKLNCPNPCYAFLFDYIESEDDIQVLVAVSTLNISKFDEINQKLKNNHFNHNNFQCQLPIFAEIIIFWDIYRISGEEIYFDPTNIRFEDIDKELENFIQKAYKTTKYFKLAEISRKCALTFILCAKKRGFNRDCAVLIGKFIYGLRYEEQNNKKRKI